MNEAMKNLLERRSVRGYPSLGFSTSIFGSNKKLYLSQTSITAGFFYVLKYLTKFFLLLYIYSAIVL